MGKQKSRKPVETEVDAGMKMEAGSDLSTIHSCSYSHIHSISVGFLLYHLAMVYIYYYEIEEVQTPHLIVYTLRMLLFVGANCSEI